MQYTIVNKSNFNSRINEVFNRVNNNARANDKGDGFGGYSSEFVAITGDDAIKLFKNSFAPDSRIETTPAPRTDGKTSGQLLPYISTEVHADTRSGCKMAHFVECCYYRISWVILFDGVFYNIPTNTRDNTKPLFYLNDTTNYSEYLPYNWEKENPAPAKIGVISDGKLKAWAQYLLNKKHAANVEKNSKENAVNEFLARVYRIDLSGLVVGVDYRLSEESGFIIKNGVRFTYKITSNKDINTKIDIYTRNKDTDILSNFERIAAGTY